MHSYRCYFLDAADHAAATEFIACATDVQAQVRADGLLAASGYPGIEVWDHGRRVYRARKVDAAGEPRSVAPEARLAVLTALAFSRGTIP
jgi:hypothetical protein